MGSIPLPALDIRPPQQPDTMGDISKLMALRSMMGQQQMQQQEIQLRAQQVKDQQATTAAMKNWDGKDYDALTKSVLDNGGSASAAQAVQQHGLGIKKTVSDIAAQDAATGSKNLDTFIKAHEAVGEALKGIESLPDDQLHAAAAAKVQELAKAGVMDPSTAQQALAGIQSVTDPAALRQNIDMFAKSSMGAKAAAELAKTQAEGEKASTEASAKRQESEFYQRSGVGAPGVPAESVQMIDWLRQNPGKTPSDYPAAKAAATSQAEAPVRIATAQAEGIARANIEAAVARGSNAALAQVPPHLVAPATAAATKAGEDYAQAQSVSQRLQAMMKDARDGNVVSYQLLPQEGALQVTTSQGVHRINMAEIQNYGGGSLWQKLEGHIGKALTGESIPESVLKDMEDMQKIQAEGSQKKYENTLKTVNQTYGANFQPVPMEPMERNTQQPTAPKGPPQGATHIGVGSLDKKKHYLDANGKDLGVAE